MSSFFEFFPSTLTKEIRTPANNLTQQENFSELLGIDEIEFKNSMFNRAALNPAEFIYQRDQAYKKLKEEVNAMFKAYTEENFNKAGTTEYIYDKTIKIPYKWENYGEKIKGLPKSEHINYAKAACMNHYALEKKKLELVFPETFTNKAQERILKGTTAIKADDKGLLKLLDESKAFDATLDIKSLV